MKTNPALIDAKIWSWSMGIYALPWFHRFAIESETLSGTVEANHRSNYNQFRSAMLVRANNSLEESALRVRIHMPTKKLLKTAVSSQRSYQELLSFYYRSFLQFGIEPAETIVLSSELGMIQFDSLAEEASKEPLRTDWRRKIEVLLPRAGLDPNQYLLALDSYLDKKADASATLARFSEALLEEVGVEPTVWRKAWDAIELKPGLVGFGVDLKLLFR